MTARKPKIYMLGGSGTGKSTLAQYIHDRFGLPMLTGATRLALEAMGTTFDAIQCNAQLADEYQAMVWRKQRELEEEHWQSETTGFVSDRSLDLLAYTAKQSRVAWTMLRSEEFQHYVQRMRTAICFFVRPHPAVRAKSDGRRDHYLTDEWRYAVDGVIEFLLETSEVPYIVLSSPCLKDRIRTVEAAIRLFGK